MDTDSSLACSFPSSYYYYRYSALGPVWAETRSQSDDWYGSGTLHPGQILRGSLPLLSPSQPVPKLKIGEAATLFSPYTHVVVIKYTKNVHSHCLIKQNEGCYQNIIVKYCYFFLSFQQAENPAARTVFKKELKVHVVVF
jgi:hypothetical protein